MRLATLLVILISCTITPSLQAYIGKIEVSPTYVHLDILESGKTDEESNMVGVRGDFFLLPKTNLCIKSHILYAAAVDILSASRLFEGGGSIGYCVSITERLMLIPLVGCNYTYVRNRAFGFDKIFGAILGYSCRCIERLRAISSFVELDIVMQLQERLRLYANFQYAWSSTNTLLNDEEHHRGHTSGPAYEAILEHDLNQNWSISLGGAYNATLIHGKFGLRSVSARLGVMRWF